MDSQFSIGKFLLQYPVSFIALISILVFVHEFGHYWVARRCGVKVEKFSIGMGPELFHWFDKHGTRWRFALIPIGGYVKMFGDADGSSRPDEAVHTMTAEEKAVSFYHKNVAQRAAIVFAGPAINYLFAWVVLIGIFLIAGQPFTPARVSKIVDASAAAQAGLQIDDQITGIGDQRVEKFQDLQQYVAMRPGAQTQLTVQRGEQELKLPVQLATVQMTDRFGGEHDIGRLGVEAKGIEVRPLNPSQAMGEATKEIYQMSSSTLLGIKQMIMGERSAKELGGPLRIAQLSGETIKEGWLAWIMLLVLISVNLGLMNLFPLPMLDGGHLVFYAIEFLRGKALSFKIQDYAMRAGMAAVMMLMLFAFWNDLVQLKVVKLITG